jgi:hypothetical protein
VEGGLGDTKTFTRKGLLAPATTAITGSDPSAATYSIEQWSVTMDQYGNSSTRTCCSAMALASKYLADVETLGINAGQSLNQIARNKLYKAYAGGRTWCTAAAPRTRRSSCSQRDGFDHSHGQRCPHRGVGANPLTVTIAGVANTVTGVNSGTPAPDARHGPRRRRRRRVVAANAPVSVRPTSATRPTT